MQILSEQLREAKLCNVLKHLVKQRHCEATKQQKKTRHCSNLEKNISR